MKKIPFSVPYSGEHGEGVIEAVLVEWEEWHPWGATTAAETLAEIEIVAFQPVKGERVDMLDMQLFAHDAYMDAAETYAAGHVI